MTLHLGRALRPLAFVLPVLAAPACAAEDTPATSEESDLTANPTMGPSLLLTQADDGRRVDLVQGQLLSLSLPASRSSEGRLIVWQLVGPLGARARELGIPNGSVPTITQFPGGPELQLVNWDTRVAEDLSGTHALRWEARPMGMSASPAIDTFEITLVIAPRRFDFDVVVGDEAPAGPIGIVMGQRLTLRLRAQHATQWKLATRRSFVDLGDPISTSWEPPTADAEGIRTIVWDTRLIRRPIEDPPAGGHYIEQPEEKRYPVEVTKWRSPIDVERVLSLKIDLRRAP
jgi:hypothetical protein